MGAGDKLSYIIVPSGDKSRKIETYHLESVEGNNPSDNILRAMQEVRGESVTDPKLSVNGETTLNVRCPEGGTNVYDTDGRFLYKK